MMCAVAHMPQLEGGGQRTLSWILGLKRKSSTCTASALPTETPHHLEALLFMSPLVPDILNALFKIFSQVFALLLHSPKIIFD